MPTDRKVEISGGTAPVLLLGILELNMDIGLLSAPVMLLSLFFPRY